jgi:uncharacterized FlgJ-related protein
MSYDQRIYNKALAEGIPSLLSQFIAAQARHETNNYSSNVFLLCNNAFGYKWVGQSTALGPCTGSPEGNSYAKYLSLEDSVYEIVRWIRRRQQDGRFPADLNDIQTSYQFAQLLKYSGYYGDSITNYANGLAYWLSKVVADLDLSGTAAKSGAGLVLAVGLAYLFRRRIREIFKRSGK